MVQPAERLIHPSSERRPRSPLHRYLERLHDSLADVDLGEVAYYIPELAAPTRRFGICLATTTAASTRSGDTRRRSRSSRSRSH